MLIKNKFAWIFFLIFFAVIGSAGILIAVKWPYALDSAHNPVARWIVVLAFTFATFTFGRMALDLKRGNLKRYGELEITVGIVVGLNSAYAVVTENTSMGSILALISGVYIIVRGLENYEKSIEPSSVK